jgi:hypothetical protein
MLNGSLTVHGKSDNAEICRPSCGLDHADVRSQDQSHDPLAAELEQMASSAKEASVPAANAAMSQRLNLSGRRLDDDEPWHPLHLPAANTPGAAFKTDEANPLKAQEGKRSE